MPDEESQEEWLDTHPIQEEFGSWADPKAVLPVEEPEQQAEDDEEYFTSFDAKWRQPFEGLTYLGHLTSEVKIPYHTFTVRTLKVGEKIRLLEMVQHLEQSIGYARAYRAAVVAAGLLTVDGKPLLVGSRNIDIISQKYQYLIDNWYEYVIDVLYDEINELEIKTIEILKELGIYDARREVAQTKTAEVAGNSD